MIWYDVLGAVGYQDTFILLGVRLFRSFVSMVKISNNDTFIIQFHLMILSMIQKDMARVLSNIKFVMVCGVAFE